MSGILPCRASFFWLFVVIRSAKRPDVAARQRLFPGESGLSRVKVGLTQLSGDSLTK